MGLEEEKETVELQPKSDAAGRDVRYRTLFDNLLEAVALYQYILDGDGEVVDWRYVDVNRAYEQAFGMSREEILGTSVMQLIGPEVMNEYLPIIRALRADKKPATHQNHYAPLDLEVLSFFAPVSDDEFIVSSLDITELERFKDDLARSNAELHQFAYVASHDLKEPLRMVTNYLALLEKRSAGCLDDKAKEFLNFALDGATRMTSMIEDLLAYSRLEVMEASFAPADVEEALDTVLMDLKVSIEESGASITHDPMPTVMADKVQLIQVLENLIGNAIKYRDVAAPKIHVSARRDGKVWTFTVEDNGIGIDMQQKDKLFNMFHRLHTRDEYEGTGMGLAIAKKIVERHGGRIWFASEPGKGTTFYFTIPSSHA
jgi:PAS domain S-box-containing protein